MSDIDHLLSRARLVPTAPYTQADIDAGERRVAARVAARLAGAASPPSQPRTLTMPPGCRHLVDPAARDLRVLCEVVLTRAGALDHLGSTLGSTLPEPSGARVLASLLYLADCEDHAKFWWQYAAGASDPVASYSLFLHHRSVGEDEEAAWWHDHTTLTPATLSEEATEVEVSTALQLLGAMRGQRTLPEHMRTLIECIPALVGFVDPDLDLPLPDADLARLVDDIRRPFTDPEEDDDSGQLSPRRYQCSAAPGGPAHDGDARWSHPVQDALHKCAQALG